MFNFVTMVKEAPDKIKNLVEGVKFIAKTELVIGVPQESGDARNAALLYIHENGAPARNIPPRPVLRLGLEKGSTFAKMQALEKAGKAKALKGDVSGAKADYEKAGMIGASSVKSVFGSDELAPNAPETIARKGSSKPLIDTGSLQGAITYVVRSK